MNPPSTLIALLLTTALCLAQAPDTAATAKNAREAAIRKYFPTVEPALDVEIGTGGDIKLHVDIAWPKTPPPAPMPAIIFFHGGGWYSGSYTNGDSMLGPWATRGYFIATAQYRLSGEAKWPAQIEDCKFAVRWLRANAARYNVDPDRIGVMGRSAGAHLAACVGVMGDEAQYEGKGGYPGVSSKPNAVVTLYAPTDLTTGTFTEGSQFTAANKDRCDRLLQAFIGKPHAEQPDLYRQASPITYVRPGLPPFLVVHGESDETVSFKQAVVFTDALKKAGVQVELLAVKNAGHDISRTLPGCPPPDPGPAQVRKAIETFLDKHLKN